jgi:clan AA aspartic protease (TIGR02281 family)
MYLKAILLIVINLSGAAMAETQELNSFSESGIPDLAWVKIDDPGKETFDQQIRTIYRMMLNADFSSAELALENTYLHCKTELQKQFVLKRWLELLTEMQKFDKILSLVERGYIDSRDVNSVLAKIYQGEEKPRTEFHQRTATMELKSHFYVPLPRVKVKLAGKNYYFVLDTGASVSVLSDKLARKLKLDLSATINVNIDTANKNTANAFVVSIPELKLGPATFYNQPAVVVDSEDLEQTFLGISIYTIDGIIGWPVLKQLALTIDFSLDKLTLSQPVLSPNKENNLVWLFDNPMVISSDPDEKQLLLFLDSGAMKSQVTQQYLTKNNLTVSNFSQKRFNGVGGKAASERTAVIPDVYFSLPSQKTHLKKINLRIDHMDCKYIQCDGRIGVDSSKSSIMYIDFANAIFDVKP